MKGAKLNGAVMLRIAWLVPNCCLAMWLIGCHNYRVGSFQGDNSHEKCRRSVSARV